MSNRRESRVRGRSIAAGLAGFGLLVAAAAPASATTLRKMDLPELVATADRIVDARAVDSVVYWDADGLQIFTDTTFEVISEAKGQGPATLVVSLLGGRIGEADMQAEGAPIFSIGDEVVLFALDRGDGKNNLVGYTQGVMRVVDEAAPNSTTVKMAVSEVPLGVTYVQSVAGQAVEVRPSPMRAPLDTLLTDIRGMIGGTRPPGPSVSTTPETDPIVPGSEIQ